MAIHEASAGLPCDRVLLATAMGTTPTSSAFTMKLNSSARYGLTTGGYSDATILLTPRGEAIVAPKDSAEHLRSLYEAALRPEPLARFYQALDGRRIPEDQYAQNMLQRELGVQPSLVAECLAMIKANGLYSGVITERDGGLFVQLGPEDLSLPVDGRHAGQPFRDAGANTDKIFIAHSDAADIAVYVSEVLGRFGLEYAIAELSESVSIPIDEGVSRQMRGCNAAVLIQGRRPEGRAATPSDPMVYQVGAASVLYGDRIVLLRERGLGETTGETNLRAIDFEPERLDELGMALLAELHEAGIIGVQVAG